MSLHPLWVLEGCFSFFSLKSHSDHLWWGSGAAERNFYFLFYSLNGSFHVLTFLTSQNKSGHEKIGIYSELKKCIYLCSMQRINHAHFLMFKVCLFSLSPLTHMSLTCSVFSWRCDGDPSSPVLQSAWRCSWLGETGPSWHHWSVCWCVDAWDTRAKTRWSMTPEAMSAPQQCASVCVYVCVCLCYTNTTQHLLNEWMFEMGQMWRVQSLCFVNAPECVTAWGHWPGSSVILRFVCVGKFVCFSFALSLAVSLDCHPSVSFSSSSFPQRLPVLCPVPLTHSHLI